MSSILVDAPARLVELQGLGRIAIRRLRADDAPAYHRFCLSLTTEDIRLRFGRIISRFDAAICRRLLDYDDAQETAFVALGGDGAVIGVGRLAAEADGAATEIALIVRSDLKRRGIGSALLEHLIGFCRARGVKELVGYVLHENVAMIELARRTGFRFADADASSQAELRLRLQPPPLS